MAISKITLNGVIQMDLTGDTVTASKLFDDYTAHGADGTSITGEYVAPTPKTADDVIVSGATVTIPAGAYSSQVQKSVASGTAGTPTASKGAVNNHSIAVTPSVTNSTGYITGSTINGTAVTVSASELVSGDKSITQNGSNIDVADYATVTVNVSGGSNADYIAFVERSTTTPVLPAGITSVGAYACYQNTTMTSITLPSSITSIEGRAFYSCTSLALTSLPNSITSFGDYAFYGCTSLALTSLPSATTAIGTYAFQKTAISISTLPSTLANVGTYAFQGCTGITSLESTASIYTMGANAFIGASGYSMNLESVSFPNMELVSLGTVFGSTTASNACQKLEFVDLGTTSRIDANAFANCYALKTLVLRKTGAYVASLANVSAFLNTPFRGYNSLTGTVYVPQSLISTYQTATNWKTLYDAGTVSFVKIEGSIYEL